jgi:hypothetical protein
MDGLESLKQILKETEKKMARNQALSGRMWKMLLISKG